jgi:GntR family transcriptional regulator
MNSLEIFGTVGLDRSSPTPLYYQLKEVLLSPISENNLSEGDRIPTEKELSDHFGVSRITVRRAINELVRDGYLVGKQGRGTFVGRPKIQRRTARMRSFSEAMLEEGRQPGSKLLSLRHEEADSQTAAALNLEPGQPVWVVERLRFADEEPICISYSYINLPAGIVLTPTDFEKTGSLWSILESKEINLSRAEVSIQSILADEEQARILLIQKNTPLLLVQGIAFDQDENPIEFHRMLNRGDRYEYNVMTTR